MIGQPTVMIILHCALCFLPGFLHSQRRRHADAAAVRRSSQEALPACAEGGVQRVAPAERLPRPDPPHPGAETRWIRTRISLFLSFCFLFYNVFPFLLQIQNQLPGAIFPYVFYPVKLPKSVTMDHGLFFILYCHVNPALLYFTMFQA